MKKGQKKRRSVILRRILAFLLAIVLVHSQIIPAVFAADTNYSQESNTEEKTVVDGAETVLPMSEDAISESSEPIQSEEQQTEDKTSEDTTVESSEPIQSGEQQTEDAADAEQSPEVETTGEAAEETVNIADAVSSCVLLSIPFSFCCSISFCVVSSPSACSITALFASSCASPSV